jgi:hypothetical protein
MMIAIRQWLNSFNEVERDLKSQGYVVVYSATGSFLVPVGANSQPPRRRRFLLSELLQLHLTRNPAISASRPV